MRWVAALALCLCAGVQAQAQGDWGVTRSGFDAATVRRYKAILARDPHDTDALRQLVAIYRRYKTLAALSADYTAQGETWNALMVLAHMPGTSTETAIALYGRALALRPDDGRGWLALAETTRDTKIAVDAFGRAVKLVSTPPDKQRALEGWLASARVLGQPSTIDAAYVELIALHPKDGRLWLDRGEAQLASGHTAEARASFAEAEKRLHTDPERRLTAMTNIGVALERDGKIDEAIAEWERTLDVVPRGYYLGAEVVAHMIDAERRRGKLTDITTHLESRWLERQRGYVEWVTLGDLYNEQKQQGRALDAYKRAVAKAPTELDAQRKLIALYDALKLPADALVQHETAARVAPGDPEIQLALAKRYVARDRHADALRVLARTAKRLRTNVNVRKQIADLYEEWNEPQLAISEYIAIMALEPTNIDHVAVLGDAYWRAGEPEVAQHAWARLATIGTASALLRQGDLLSEHELWDDAIEAYTAAAAKDPTIAAIWSGRARAHASRPGDDQHLDHYEKATADARRAIALIGLATEADGLPQRSLLLRVLDQTAFGDATRKSAELWSIAFEHGDNVAGYLLAAHYGRHGDPRAHDVLSTLHARIPGDESLGFALARSHVTRGEYAKARAVLVAIAKQNPKRAEDIALLVEQVDRDAKRIEADARWVEQGGQGHAARTGAPDITGGKRWGLGFVIGADVLKTESAVGGVAVYRDSPLAPGTALALRAESLRRTAYMEDVRSVVLGAGVVRRIIDTRKLEVAAGLGALFEFRFVGDSDRQWDRAALGAGASLELMPRGIPATLGLRWRQSLTDESGASMISVEIGFESR